MVQWKCFLKVVSKSTEFHSHLSMYQNFKEDLSAVALV